MLNGCFVNPSSATKLVWGVQVKAAQGHDQIVFSRRVIDSTSPSPPKPTPPSSCLCRDLFPLLSCSLPSLHPSSPPPSPICRVTACRCCVRVSWTGAVWSECVVSSSAERLLTGWMRESNTVYFNLFRMLELCSGFLRSLTALLAASISHSCTAGRTALASQTGTFLSICLFNPLWLRNVNGTAEC